MNNCDVKKFAKHGIISQVQIKKKGKILHSALSNDGIDMDCRTETDKMAIIHMETEKQ